MNIYILKKLDGPGKLNCETLQPDPVFLKLTFFFEWGMNDYDGAIH